LILLAVPKFGITLNQGTLSGYSPVHTFHDQFDVTILFY